MMKTFLSLLIVSFVLGCADTDENMKLQLLNPEIYYVSGNEYESVYANDTVREKSTNLVTFSLHNPTGHKLLLAFDRNELWPASSFEKGLGALSFIVSEDGKPIRFTSPLVTFSHGMAEGVFDQQLYSDSLMRAKYLAMGVARRNIQEVNDFITNAVILYPNETRTFSFLVNLPIVKEISAKRAQVPVYYYRDALNDKCTFQLYYSCDSARVKKILPKYFIEELAHNNIEIYDGILKSNEVKLKLKE